MAQSQEEHSVLFQTMWSSATQNMLFWYMTICVLKWILVGVQLQAHVGA